GRPARRDREERLDLRTAETEHRLDVDAPGDLERASLADRADGPVEPREPERAGRLAVTVLTEEVPAAAPHREPPRLDRADCHLARARGAVAEPHGGARVDRVDERAVGAAGGADAQGERAEAVRVDVRVPERPQLRHRAAGLRAERAVPPQLGRDGEHAEL